MQESEAQGTPPAQAAMSRPDAGLGALFDFGFSTFITLGVMKILYMLGMLLIALMWLVGIVMGFVSGGFVGGIVGIVVVSIAAVLYLIFLRVWLELICVIFRIGENTTKLVQASQH